MNKQISVRRPVAVLVSRFPLITETFILREINELERMGQPVLLVPMIREEPKLVHQEARPWIDRALYTPWLSMAIIAAGMRALVKQPPVLARLLSWIVKGALFRPSVLFRTLLLFPKSVYLAERLREAGVRHIHAHFATHPSSMARIISELSGISFSFTVHAHDIFVERALLREKIRDARFVRAISDFNKSFLESLYPAEAGEKIVVVHVGIDPERYAPSPANQNEDALPRLICVAALKPYKGVTFLVEACRLLALEGIRVRCDIIGAGPLRNSIQQAIGRGGLNGSVRLRGALPQEILSLEIGSSDMFVLPSIIAADGQMEGIPVALMEAMAAEKPVVATAISGIPELVEHGVSGLLVDPANPRSLADAIRTLLEDRELAELLGKAGRRVVEREFHLRSCTAALLEVLDGENPPLDDHVLSILQTIGTGGSFGLRTVRRGSDAAVYEICCSEGFEDSGLIVKRHLARHGESRPPSRRAADEWRFLERLAVHFSDQPGIGVPRPIAFDEASNTLVMTAAPGSPLTRIIRAARGAGHDATGLSQFLGALRGTGAWLQHFQTFESGDGSEALASVVSRAIEDAEKAGAPFRIRRRIEALHRELSSRDRVARSHHGDLWPGNIFASSQRIEVIDFEGYGLSLAAHDVAYLFLHLSLYFRARGDRLMDLARESLFDGYGDALDPAELELCRLAVALQLGARRQSSFVQTLMHRTIVRRELAR